MRLSFIFLMSIFTPLSQAAPYTVFRDGESFTYRVGWGIFMKAGEIKISAKSETLEGQPAIRIVMHTASRGIVRDLYSYDDTAEALIDVRTGRLLRATDVADNGEKLADATTSFDYVQRKVTHEDRVRPGRNREFPMPANCDPVDLISALIQTRDWATDVGMKRDACIFAGQDVYPVTIYGEAFESIPLKGGEVRALMLSPRMETEAPRGVFKRGGEIKVWVSQDGERLPVKMQLKLKIGTAHLTLIEHKVPTSTIANSPSVSTGTDKTEAGHDAPRVPSS